MKVAIRDDDVNYFTNIKDISNAYGDILSYALISFALVPFYYDHDTNREYPIGGNNNLIEYLRNLIANRKAYIILHGYNHANEHNTPEFMIRSDLTEKVVGGKVYLEKIFGQGIEIFVPPHNVLSKKGIIAIEKAHLNLLGSIPLNPFVRGFSFNGLFYLLYKLYYMYRNANLGKLSNVIPSILNFRNHKELGCYSLIPGRTLEELTRAFNTIREHNSIFCLNTHYWEINRHSSLKSILNDFLAYLKKQSVDFCFANDLFTEDLI
jgi:hypothetical protein